MPPINLFHRQKKRFFLCSFLMSLITQLKFNFSLSHLKNIPIHFMHDDGLTKWWAMKWNEMNEQQRNIHTVENWNTETHLYSRYIDAHFRLAALFDNTIQANLIKSKCNANLWLRSEKLALRMSSYLCVYVIRSL